MLHLKTVEASVSIAQTSSVAAVHESAIGTELFDSECPLFGR